MKRLFGFALVLAFMLSGIATVFAQDEIESIGPEDAYDMLNPDSDNPDYSYNPNAYILDVRTPCEWNWIGHPGMDKCGNGTSLDGKVINIPWELWGFDQKTKQYDLEPNKFFDEEVVRQFDPDVDILILMCRSGTRGGKACVEIGTEQGYTHPAHKRLEKLGYFEVYNMSGGFEGGKDKCGYRTLDAGWKNLGLPYNYSDKGIWTPQQKGRSLNPK
jgi:rhodanese-related sulfurtransferase